MPKPLEQSKGKSYLLDIVQLQKRSDIPIRKQPYKKQRIRCVEMQDKQEPISENSPWLVTAAEFRSRLVRSGVKVGKKPLDSENVHQQARQKEVLTGNNDRPRIARDIMCSYPNLSENDNRLPLEGSG